MQFNFTMLSKQWAKEKKRLYIIQNRRKTKQRYHDDICKWKRDSFPSDVEIRRGIFLKENFQKELMNLTDTNYQINMTSEHCFKL